MVKNGKRVCDCLEGWIGETCSLKFCHKIDKCSKNGI